VGELAVEGNSVFSAPARRMLAVTGFLDALELNGQATGRGLSLQT